ncbi:L,D-transpeptidase family protein [Actinacidiphila alni]|uniref:L,D-transpeptidase family protein n=1 Tax=Actinacidiphila alni TaxID=380248 RepID=UPI003451B417
MTSAPAGSYSESRSAESRGRHRHRRKKRALRRRAGVGAAAFVVLAVVGAGYVVLDRHGAGSVAADTGKNGGHGAAPAAAPSTSAAPAGPDTMSVKDEEPTAIPGLGPKTRSAIPAASKQVLVASGKAKNSADSTVTLWSRTADGHWKPGAVWPAHNALRGWTAKHHAGDLHSPIGVFTLSDAGGFDADPGAKLPYHHSSAFRAGGVGFDGEPLDEAFDYVIAINYNRVPGTSPLDGTQPLGPSRGGGIWVHVDHGGPTHGCVSVSASHMVDLLHTLVPADHPVIVMGDHGSLAT